MVAQAQAPVKPREYARCDTCGSLGLVGTDLARTLVWQGGQGWVERTGCVNGVICWTRWERQQRELAAARKAGREGMARLLAAATA